MSWGKYISSKLSDFLKTKRLSDVTLTVGKKPMEKQFNVHRMVLSVSSEVFEAMFFGELSENVKQFTFSEDDPDDFEILIKYVYTGELTLKSLEIAINLLLLADKYLIYQLKQDCVDYLSQNVSSDLVIQVRKIATQLSERKLQQDCWEYIKRHASNVLKAESFKYVDLQTITDIFTTNNLNVASEVDLYDAAVRWGKYQCEMKGLSITGLNVRREIKQVLNYIRFFTMSAEEFARRPAMEDIFTQEEIHNILLNIIVPGLKSYPANIDSSSRSKRYYNY